MSAEVTLKISWKSNEKSLKQKLYITLKYCFNHEQNLIGIVILISKASL